MKIYKEIVAESNYNMWITVPGVRIVHVGIQDNNICIWYTFSEEDPEIGFQYKIIGTGWDFDGACIVAGSVIHGPFVWHVLERNAR